MVPARRRWNSGALEYLEKASERVDWYLSSQGLAVSKYPSWHKHREIQRYARCRKERDLNQRAAPPAPCGPGEDWGWGIVDANQVAGRG